jgi:hypothetical protein
VARGRFLEWHTLTAIRFADRYALLQLQPGGEAMASLPQMLDQVVLLQPGDVVGISGKPPTLARPWWLLTSVETHSSHGPPDHRLSRDDPRQGVGT